MSYVDRPATIGDVIAWVFAIPTFVFAIFIGPYLPSTLQKFEPMFKSLNAKLPAVTIFMLDHGWWLLPTVPIVVSVLVLVGLLFLKSGWTKIAVAVIGCKIVMLVVGTMIASIFYPILELQKTLS